MNQHLSFDFQFDSHWVEASIRTSQTLQGRMVLFMIYQIENVFFLLLRLSVFLLWFSKC